MDMLTLLVDVAAGMWLLALIMGIVRAWQARTPRLAPLSLEARDRFVSSWHRIAVGFVDAPREAVQQADALVLSLLRERGWPAHQEKVPKPIRQARQWLARENSNGTEALRQAMLHYRSIFTRSIGRRPTAPDGQETRRREMA